MLGRGFFRGTARLSNWSFGRRRWFDRHRLGRDGFALGSGSRLLSSFNWDRFFGLDVTNESFPLGLAANAVRLRILDTRGMAFDADAERDTKVERLFVGESEFFAELVYSNLRCQAGQSLVLCGGTAIAGKPSEE